MTTSTCHPHDKLFRTIFADKQEAESFLRGYLPEVISNQLDWQTLTLVETSFVDEVLKESESDVLYQIQHRSTQTPIVLYLLFEIHCDCPVPANRLQISGKITTSRTDATC